ncbi:verrucotoxin subunit beta-like [Engraulis encrasicolus]|uniref:verrucotoxin subunit beta-like n=1 Tax=Engraulis encrasicolus TaxID=184585 RepID=UPI002FCF84A9
MASSDKTADVIETAALGRPFCLGMLYDCRSETLIPGVTLWNPEELKDHIVEDQPNSEYNVIKSDSITQKADSFNISGSLKLCILGGKVNISGSANYLNNTKTSLKQERLTLQYTTTTKVKRLTMSQLAHKNITYQDVSGNGLATHVVTAIEYGAGAYFVFVRQSYESYKDTDGEGQVNVMLDKIKGFSADAEVALTLTNEEKSAVDTFRCTFHGDFNLPNNPVTFEQAVNAYKTLPSLLGENGEHAIPVRVWMYPLTKLNSEAAKLEGQISDNLVIRTTAVIEEFKKTEMRCNDLKSINPILPEMEKKIQIFMKNCSVYKLQFTEKLGSVLPSIRGGGQEEIVLTDILEKHEKSPFNSKDLDQWLTQKENESHTQSIILGRLKEMDVDMDANLDELLVDLNSKKIVSFSFTSVAQTDDFLETLSNFLSTTLRCQQEPKEKEETGKEEEQKMSTGYLSHKRKRKIRKQLNLFKKLKMLLGDEAKFIVGSQYDASNPGVCIYVWEEGSDDFVPFNAPSKPDTPVVHKALTDGFILQASKADSATVKYVVEVKPHEGEWERLSEQTSPGWEITRVKVMQYDELKSRWESSWREDERRANIGKRSIAKCAEKGCGKDGN